MRVFLAGATGVVGRRITPLLVQAGHVVVGLTRTPSKAHLVREMGAEPVVCDALDRAGMRAAVMHARPDAVIHQVTAIPVAVKLKNIAQEFALTNRLRTQGTDILLEAARECGVRRFLAQGFGGYRWPNAAAAPSGMRAIVEGIEYLERVVPAAGGLVLRYGGFYGPTTSLARDSATVDLIRKRQFPVVGGGTGEWSFVHIDDVAGSTVLALERGDAGIYNIADDEPARVSEWLPALAEAIGAPKPRSVPAWLGRLLAGENAVGLMTTVRGIDNREAKRILGWELKWPVWREGFRRGL